MQNQKFDVLVVGSGVHGLSISYYLAKKQLKVAIMERYAIGHQNGSSYSDTRVYHSGYHKQFYQKFAKLAYTEYWKDMEKQFKTKLIYDSKFVYYDQTDTYADLSKLVTKDNESFKFITSEQVVQRFPGMPILDTTHKPIIQEYGALIDAKNYIDKLTQELSQMPNVTIFQNTIVKTIRSNEKNVSIQTEEDNVEAEKVVVACGKWVNQLIPETVGLVKVVRQIIAKVCFQDSSKFKYDRFPPWNHKDKNSTYCIEPSLKQNSVYVSERLTSFHGTYESNKKLRIYNLQKRINSYFLNEAKVIKQIKQCCYTMTKSSDFIVDWVDQSQRVLVCSACSGHGFKFAPLIGRIVSDLIEQDESIDLFQKNRYLFRIPYHAGINLL